MLVGVSIAGFVFLCSGFLVHDVSYLFCTNKAGLFTTFLAFTDYLSGVPDVFGIISAEYVICMPCPFFGGHTTLAYQHVTFPTCGNLGVVVAEIIPTIGAFCYFIFRHTVGLHG